MGDRNSDIPGEDEWFCRQQKPTALRPQVAGQAAELSFAAELALLDFENESYEDQPIGRDATVTEAANNDLTREFTHF